MIQSWSRLGARLSNKWFSFPGSAWERVSARLSLAEPPFAGGVGRRHDARQSLAGSAFPGGALGTRALLLGRPSCRSVFQEIFEERKFQLQRLGGGDMRFARGQERPMLVAEHRVDRREVIEGLPVLGGILHAA